jgi:hypothetical protein
MDVHFKFAVGAKVTIYEISATGIIRVARCDRGGNTYLVEYWWEGQLKEVVLTEDEIK